jgi:hypothetical protein
MNYGDIFGLDEDEIDHSADYTNNLFGSMHGMKRDKRFYKMYASLMQCHLIQLNGKFVNFKLRDISTMKSTDRILDIVVDDDTVHVFNVESFQNVKFKNHSIVLENQKEEKIELIPCQLRSMVTNGRVSTG